MLVSRYVVIIRKFSILELGLIIYLYIVTDLFRNETPVLSKDLKTSKGILSFSVTRRSCILCVIVKSNKVSPTN